MALSNKINLERKFFCVITGASKGIGRTIALKLAAKFKAGSVLVLLARSENGLYETKAAILAVNQAINVVVVPIDLSKPDSAVFEDILKSSLKVPLNDFDTAMIVHNVGSVGDVSKKVIDLNDLTYWQDYYTLNVFGVSMLNSAFIKLVDKTHNIPHDTFKTVIVNITSLVAIKPLKNMGYYGSGKAAREMLFKVLAEEEKYVLVLNYSPGPVQTDMINIIIDHVGDTEIKQNFTSLRDENKILSTDQTTSKLLEVINEGKYKSGDHVDYFDDLECSLSYR